MSVETSIEWLKNKWKGWKEKNFLESYGCKTWREYELKYDPDVYFGAETSSGFYKGYKHVIAYRWMYQTYDPKLSNEIIAWCEETCQGKWRTDFHRCQTGRFINVMDTAPFNFNGLGNEDIRFFAFKDGEDALAFSLRWL